ncbi:M15 family metallopeptidase [Cellulomonas sp. URHE0023]|uniref:M15 family metallopeptidase n=1 Tax=Cellulomonas sp. URHE0023 TaxID=1380354 RepID=UPI0004834CB0|nr:M15 family metallopeptidase [Cellulomonas sp. URHE0023]
MFGTPPAREARPAVPVALAVVVTTVAAVSVAVFGGKPSAATSPSAAPDAPSRAAVAQLPRDAPVLAPPSADDPVADDPGLVGADGSDGAVADGVTVFDDGVPAVANLDPDLLAAVREAATDAADERITFYVNSGWRSRAFQDQLLRDAVVQYGSEQEAARWVATSDTSPHVQGAAIDVGRWDATAWLAEHGAQYGLCQIYGNEPWHYELRPDAVDAGCPAMYADPTHDPRMQQ